MSVEMWPVSGSTTPFGLRTFGSKKSVARLMTAPAGSLGSTSWPLLPCALDAAAQQAVAEAEGHGGELGGDGGIDVGVVAGVRRQGVRAEQVGQILRCR